MSLLELTCNGIIFRHMGNLIINDKKELILIFSTVMTDFKNLIFCNELKFFLLRYEQITTVIFSNLFLFNLIRPSQKLIPENTHIFYQYV